MQPGDGLVTLGPQGSRTHELSTYRASRRGRRQTISGPRGLQEPSGVLGTAKTMRRSSFTRDLGSGAQTSRSARSKTGAGPVAWLRRSMPCHRPADISCTVELSIVHGAITSPPYEGQQPVSGPCRKALPMQTQTRSPSCNRVPMALGSGHIARLNPLEARTATSRRPSLGTRGERRKGRKDSAPAGTGSGRPRPALLNAPVSISCRTVGMYPHGVISRYLEWARPQALPESKLARLAGS